MPEPRDEPRREEGRARPRRGRAVAVGAASVLAVLALAVSVGWETGRDWWWDAEPRIAATPDADGAVTIGAYTISLVRIEPSQQLVLAYETVDAPPGWQLWLADLDVTVAAAAQDDGTDADSTDGTDDADDGTSDLTDRYGGLTSPWLSFSVVASDGKTYSRPSAFTSGSPPDGWLDSVPDETGRYQNMVLLPDGVEPVRVRLVPSPKTPYWSFPVDG